MVWKKGSHVATGRQGRRIGLVASWHLLFPWAPGL